MSTKENEMWYQGKRHLYWWAGCWLHLILLYAARALVYTYMHCTREHTVHSLTHTRTHTVQNVICEIPSANKQHNDVHTIHNFYHLFFFPLDLTLCRAFTTLMNLLQQMVCCIFFLLLLLLVLLSIYFFLLIVVYYFHQNSNILIFI